MCFAGETLAPTSSEPGRRERRGDKVCGLLQGRENVYLNGAILGLHRGEIEERVQAIVEFAEIGAFIDAPVRMRSAAVVA